ncbi:hypothetical protein [Kitasatospora sp. DSM 101779]|uniref:hypothetical protein n=1 Tax=Kitasatospora sp. DSM 101779 TaxID=2853165 RepID=UPI0021D881E4|nr:hypothetical protein [Kitasatospora sp. DSM 101779]MCU7825939.1 hypothetical protein [Kitasatospora sp. DSM 101779]
MGSAGRRHLGRAERDARFLPCSDLDARLPAHGAEAAVDRNPSAGGAAGIGAVEVDDSGNLLGFGDPAERGRRPELHDGILSAV